MLKVFRHNQDTVDPAGEGTDLLSWLVGWLVKFWLGLLNPMFLPAWESEIKRNNVAVLSDIYLSFR